MNSTPHSPAPRGFTLIEIMVAMALLLALFGSTFGVLIATNNSTQRTYRIANAQESARLALDALAADLRAAGLGVSAGEVGVAPGASSGSSSASEYFIPVIYSGPDMVVQQPYQRSSLITNSVYIIGADPATIGIPISGVGTQGVVTDGGPGLPMEILCGTADGGNIGCETGPSAIYLGTSTPLLVGDLRHAAVVTPTGLSPENGSKNELMTYQESSVLSYSSDPKSPYGISAGSMLSRLRVVHWYLRQDDPNAPPRLYRSLPVMAAAGSSFSCTAGAAPFQDETTGNPAVVGQEMGAGPIQSLQIRYILYGSDTDTGGQFLSYQMASAISPCDTADVSNNVVPQAVTKLREVRLEVVALSDQPDLSSAASSTLTVGYGTPTFEGSLWAPDGGSLTDAGQTDFQGDPYPRRAFTVRVVPRAIQGARL